VAESEQAPQITTLHEFLKHSGAQFRVFDMSRRGNKVSAEQFIAFEEASAPYPYPIQKKAHFGLVFWNPDLAQKHYIWFLSFPLDEQGLLIQAARDEFLVMLLDRVGECMLAANEGDKIEGALKDSPYTFKPRDDKMAVFHAQASVELTMPASQYYPAALAYYTGNTAVDNWQSLAMQGVADVAVRIEDKDIDALVTQLPNFPEAPFSTLCQSMECRELPTKLVEAISSYLTQQCQKEESNISLIVACLRAVSSSPAQGLIRQMVEQTLQHPVAGQNIEVLATISGRLWQVLEQSELCQLFLEKLAINEAGQQGFSHIVADAMYMPGLREPVMAALRSESRSPALSAAVGQMFGQSA